MSILKEPILAE